VGLPSAKWQRVGLFIFFDALGPAAFVAGGGVDTRSRPHIGLATPIDQIEGAIVHGDSAGQMQRSASAKSI